VLGVPPAPCSLPCGLPDAGSVRAPAWFALALRGRSKALRDRLMSGMQQEFAPDK